MDLTTETLRQTVLGLHPQAGTAGSAVNAWVAYSGGLDSHVLLHALAAIQDELPGLRLGAAHVNHGLSSHASTWSAHCEAVCRELGVPLRVFAVDARAASGESPEARARHARYEALEQLVDDGDCLITAHHLDDQAETVLLQLLRGSGPRGLAAMPPRSRFAAGWLLRPLLAVPRAALEAYANTAGLEWVEDPSNYDTGFQRNHLRHQVIPGLRKRWPGLPEVLARTARQQAELAGLLDVLAGDDLRCSAGVPAGTLSVAALRRLDAPRQRNLIRYWLRQRGLPVPPARQLEHVRTDVLDAGGDRTPLVQWEGAEVRRYRDDLYAMKPIAAWPELLVLPWDMHSSLALPHQGGIITAVPVTGSGLRMASLGGTSVTIRRRQGGERCRPAGRRHHHDLKKLFQDTDVPPWERERMPLVYVGDALAAVADLWVCDEFAAGPGESGLRIEWHRGNPG